MVRTRKFESLKIRNFMQLGKIRRIIRTLKQKSKTCMGAKKLKSLIKSRKMLVTNLVIKQKNLKLSNNKPLAIFTKKKVIKLRNFRRIKRVILKKKNFSTNAKLIDPYRQRILNYGTKNNCYRQSLLRSKLLYKLLKNYNG